MAGRGARAAACEGAHHRFLGLKLACFARSVARCLFAAVARTRLDRGSQSLDRISLGRRQRDRAAELAGEVVRLKVDIILTYATPMVLAAKQATPAIPIVFALAADPLGSGLVASLARPGGNVTGLSLQHTDLASKKVELLRDLIPGLRRLAILANATNFASVREMGEVQAAARMIDLEVVTFEIERAEDIAPVFAELKDRAEALYICIDTILFSNQTRINTLARDARLPTIQSDRASVEAGGLMSYGPNFLDLFRRAADYVDKILRGAKPGDIPV